MAQLVNESYRVFQVTDGLWPGDCWPALCFSFALAKAVRGFRAEMAGSGVRVRLVAYLDDLVLVLRMAGLRMVADSPERWLRSVGLDLEMSKSFCMLCAPDAEPSALVAELGFQQAFGQVEVL